MRSGMKERKGMKKERMSLQVETLTRTDLTGETISWIDVTNFKIGKEGKDKKQEKETRLPIC